MTSVKKSLNCHVCFRLPLLKQSPEVSFDCVCVPFVSSTRCYPQTRNITNNTEFCCRIGVQSAPGSRRSSARSSLYGQRGTRIHDFRSLMQRSPEEQKAWLENLARPTMASTQRFCNPQLGWHAQHRYITINGSRYLWHRMDYMRDTYKMLWNPDGGVKVGYTK